MDAESKVSKRKTEPKASTKKKTANKEVPPTSPRKKTKDTKRRSANIDELVVEDNKKNRTVRASISTSNEVLPSVGDKPKNESDEDFVKWSEVQSAKAKAKREENERNEKKTKKNNGNKSPRVKKETPDLKTSKNEEPKEKENSESDSDVDLASILSSLDELTNVNAFLSKLSKLLEDPIFSAEFTRKEGFEKLSMQLVKITDTNSLVLILSFLEKAFRDCPGVFEHVFTESAVMVTTLVWLLVKVNKSDLIVTAKVYLLLASLPAITYAKNFPEIEIHNLIFSAMNLYHQKSDERLRFQNLIKALQTNSKELKLAVLKLINALIGMYQSVEERIGMRLEFISLGLEEALSKSTEELKPEILEEISHYDILQQKDLESYKQLHANIISPAWIEGKDLQLLGHTLTTRWASLPNQQSVVVSTLCSLLHIPKDEIVGTAKWLFLNKVVSQVVDDVQEKLILEGCDKIDLQPVLRGIGFAEVIAKKELDDEKLRSQQLAERIRSLEAQISQFTENSPSGHNPELLHLKKNLSDVSAKLFEMEKKLNSETEIANQLQINYKELQSKYEILENQDQENLTHIKKLQKKLEEQEKTLQVKQTGTSGEDRTSATVTSTVVVPSPPPEQTGMPIQLVDSGINLGKEEQRMIKAISKFGGSTQSSNWMRTPVPPVISPRIDLESPSPNGLNSPQKVPRITSPRSSDFSSQPNSSEANYPEWKKRQLEKERLDKEKLEREQQRKLEMLSSVTGTTSLTLTGSLSGSETSVASPVIEVGTPEVDEENLVRPGSELSLEEREELRLARTLNRPRGQRSSQVHT